MAVVTQTTLNPNISPNATEIAGPVDPDAFRTNLNTYVAAVEDKAQQAVAFIEQLQRAIGNGALSGGVISAGAGLSVSIAALKALVGTVIEVDAASTVGGLTDATTNYIFLRENGTWTVNTTGTAPSDTATYGDYLLWGTATTSGGAVTAVSNVRDTFRLMKPANQQRRIVKTGEVCHVGKEMQVRYFGGLTITGGLKIEGRLRIDP